MEVIKQVLENSLFQKFFQRSQEDLLVFNFSPDSYFRFYERVLR